MYSIFDKANITPFSLIKEGFGSNPILNKYRSLILLKRVVLLIYSTQEISLLQLRMMDIGLKKTKYYKMLYNI